MPLTIEQLSIYPVKSLRGFSVDSAKLTETGLQYDRFWMIINDDNLFVTQRKFSEMVLIFTAIENGYLILSKPSAPSLEPLKIAIDETPSGASFSARVWKDTCDVLDEGETASEWLAKALPNAGHLRLVRMDPLSKRPQSKPELLGEDTHTYFSDAAPLLVTNTASLTALNEHLLKNDIDAVTMENFRPNIVISGLEAFEEHKVSALTHNDYTLQHCYPCQRCAVPTVNVETGVRHPRQEPFSLLAAINAMPDNAKAPAFGENAIIINGENQDITVGDTLTAQY